MSSSPNASHKLRRAKAEEDAQLDELIQASLGEQDKKLQERKMTYIYKKINEHKKKARTNDPRIKIKQLWDEISKEKRKQPESKGKTRSQTIDMMVGKELVGSHTELVDLI